MGKTRKQYGSSFKAKVALEAVKEIKPINELAAVYQVHRVQICKWKKELLDGIISIFDKDNKSTNDHLEWEKERDDLHRQIGAISVERDWLKKKTAELSIDTKRALIDRKHEYLTIADQCALLALPRSTLYYQPYLENKFNLELMRAIDEIFTDNPEYGTRRIKVLLERRGYSVGRQLIRSLMQTMGIEAIYPKPNLSKPSIGHKIYPYLLRGLKIERVNQVWSTDITYIRMREGFLYLTAIIDWYSRYVLSWRLSNTLDGLFCREALVEALNISTPEIFNTDQGVQYTNESFLAILLKKGIKPSMDGRGRALDNIFVERLWRSIKYENIFLNDYQNGLELFLGVEKYFKHYNEDRPHMSLNYKCPINIYYTGSELNYTKLLTT